MRRAEYDEYIRRFNEEDPTAFDDYIAPDMRMLNGALEFRGIEGMRDHYERRIWPFFREELNVLRFVGDDDSLAVQMWAGFIPKQDAADTLFGPVVAGERFDFRGLILYELDGGRFRSITVAYNSFAHTDASGARHELGIPH
jgi:hypothetical protein